ncbi:formimidoylglutamase [Bhargavaea massiliensis]|uniref:formimidoylglutamase n=1 Tax=Bhargavaea massiliensis TaxID=2697500 RepID=UPI001BCC6B59|nr:formimidoylglutamase [Bhargavaea massiliensis]
MGLEEIWKGTVESSADQNRFKYHQIVRGPDFSDKANVALIGFCCDEGVRRNNGRPGAAKAPDAIRAALAPMPWHGNEATLCDYGNVSCGDSRLEDAQDELAAKVSEAYGQGSRAVILGGGHETLYGHYLGLRLHLGSEASIGILNIDAHFDLRPHDGESSSGTMFRQILEEDQNAGYFVLGIQRFGNSLSLFETAQDFDVDYMPEETVRQSDPAQLSRRIQSFIGQYDAVIVTLCMDVLDMASAPGVSAPSPFGLDPVSVRSIIRAACSHPAVRSFDISEVNPDVDEGGRTVRLGAALTNEAILSFLGKAPEI